MSTSGPTVHTLKVALRRVSPVVWRRVVVQSEMPLSLLGWTLEAVMGWDGSHLHQFDANGKLFAAPDDGFDAGRVIDERSVTVKDVLPRVRSSLRFDYDFGDGWEHDVFVERIGPPDDGERYPTCIDGERAGPPEDCGGVWGYERILVALSDPSNPDNADTLEWVGEEFDPAEFDVADVNRRFRRI